MYSAELFLGFPVDSFFSQKISQLDPHYISLFIQNNETYLREINCEHGRYFGKSAGQVNDLASLEMLECNIYSLLKKLLPDHPYEQIPLILFPLLSRLPYDS